MALDASCTVIKTWNTLRQIDSQVVNKRLTSKVFPFTLPVYHFVPYHIPSSLSHLYTLPDSILIELLLQFIFKGTLNVKRQRGLKALPIADMISKMYLKIFFNFKKQKYNLKNSCKSTESLLSSFNWSSSMSLWEIKKSKKCTVYILLRLWKFHNTRKVLRSVMPVSLCADRSPPLLKGIIRDSSGCDSLR